MSKKPSLLYLTKSVSHFIVTKTSNKPVVLEPKTLFHLHKAISAVLTGG